jgi:RNA polymerase sigma factor (sigma-70 family)
MLRSGEGQALKKRRPRPDSRLHRVPVPAQERKPAAAIEVYWSPRKKVEFYTFDAEYLRRLKAEDPTTQAHFASYFSEMLRMKARHRGLDWHHVEDVCQETFYRVLKALQGESVQFPEKFGGYVSSVCENVILEKYRDFSRNQHLDLENMEIPDGRDNLETAFLRSEKGRMVAKLLGKMSPKKRNILRALIYEQLDREQMCKRFAVSRAYLRVQLFRAIEEFERLWKDEGLDQQPF